ncbi:MAG: anti-sigma F factor [Clostridia bacterium]|nr:anti-sigma F factor [Clostridia bacterium]
MSGRKKENEMRMTMDSKSVNEGFARVSVSAFVAPLDPTVEELQDIKTAVSEAVTNCIVHAYEDSVGKIYITCTVYEGGVVRIKIRDNGCGIEDIKQAMMPLYTTKGDERSGLGFAVMESFMDKLRVRSVPQRGTTVVMEKRIHGRELHGQ